MLHSFLKKSLYSVTFFILVAFLSGCSSSVREVCAEAGFTSFVHLSEEERLLASQALWRSLEVDAAASFPIRSWLEVYLKENSPRVARELERALEHALGGPLVGHLVLEASAGTSLSEAAACRLLGDPRQAVRLCAVRSLTSLGTPEALFKLRTLFLSETADSQTRFAAAQGLFSAGQDAFLVQWCDGQPPAAPADESTRDLMQRVRDLFTAQVRAVSSSESSGSGASASFTRAGPSAPGVQSRKAWEGGNPW